MLLSIYSHNAPRPTWCGTTVFAVLQISLLAISIIANVKPELMPGVGLSTLGAALGLFIIDLCLLYRLHQKENIKNNRFFQEASFQTKELMDAAHKDQGIFNLFFKARNEERHLLVLKLEEGEALKRKLLEGDFFLYFNSATERGIENISLCYNRNKKVLHIHQCLVQKNFKRFWMEEFISKKSKVAYPGSNESAYRVFYFGAQLYS